MNEANMLADYLQRFSTKVLWHFTGYNKTEEEAYERLVSITKNKQLKVSEKPAIIKMSSGEERWGYEHSCMCDIPFKDLKIHIARYGCFGVAFKKESAVLKGFFNPVLYMHKDHHLFKHAETLLKQLDKLSSPHERLEETLQEFLILLGTYVIKGDLLSDIHLDPSMDEEQKNNFYYEREWRSAYKWDFNETDVVAVMLTQEKISDFKNKLGDEFPNMSIISAEMVEKL